MVLEKFVDTRKEVFKRPNTVRDILGNKKEIIEVHSFDDIVPALERREENQGFLFKNSCIDIPDAFYSPQNYTKRGPYVTLRTFDGNARKLRENEWNEFTARATAEENYKRKNGPFIGWRWKDPEKYWHMVRPTTAIEGHRIVIYGIESGSITEKTTQRKYTASDSSASTVRVEIPSRSTEGKRAVIIEHFPYSRGVDRFEEWTRVRTRHECPQKLNDFTLRHNARTVSYCPHDAAAYIARSRRIAETEGRVIPQIFPMFTESTLRLFFSAAYHSMFEKESSVNGKKRTEKKPLSVPQIDMILMDAWLLHGNKQTFFVRSPTKQYKSGPPIGRRKRMRDYDWDNPNAPGIPFGSN